MCTSKFGALSLLLCSSFVISACGTTSYSSTIKTDYTPSTEKGDWNSEPEVLEATSPGTQTATCDVSTIDYSNSSEGYITVNYTGENEKVKLQITGPDDVTYTYNLHGDYETFPLTAGDGNYNIGVYENIEGTSYSTALSSDIAVTITNEFGPYLYPNQYVNFSATSKAVSKSADLAYYCSSDIEVVESVYNYLISNFTYDYEKAATVESGYLPDVDEIYTTNTGICFDYAAVMATMLRSQGIPTRLEVGYVDEAYHAWVSTYIQDIGWINGIIEFDGESWNIMDPTFASTSSSPKDFITKDSQYLTKYVY